MIASVLQCSIICLTAKSRPISQPIKTILLALVSHARRWPHEYASMRARNRKIWKDIEQYPEPTYPSPKPTSTLASHLRQNVGLGQGKVGSFLETYNDPNCFRNSKKCPSLLRASNGERKVKLCKSTALRPSSSLLRHSPLAHALYLLPQKKSKRPVAVNKHWGNSIWLCTTGPPIYM